MVGVSVTRHRPPPSACAVYRCGRPLPAGGRRGSSCRPATRSVEAADRGSCGGRSPASGGEEDSFPCGDRLPLQKLKFIVSCVWTPRRSDPAGGVLWGGGGASATAGASPATTRTASRFVVVACASSCSPGAGCGRRRPWAAAVSRDGGAYADAGTPRGGASGIGTGGACGAAPAGGRPSGGALAACVGSGRGGRDRRPERSCSVGEAPARAPPDRIEDEDHDGLACAAASASARPGHRPA